MFQTPLETLQTSLELFQTCLETFQTPLESFQNPLEKFQTSLEMFQTPLETFQSPLELFQKVPAGCRRGEKDSGRPRERRNEAVRWSAHIPSLQRRAPDFSGRRFGCRCRGHVVTGTGTDAFAEVDGLLRLRTATAKRGDDHVASIAAIGVGRHVGCVHHDGLIFQRKRHTKHHLTGVSAEDL